MSKSPDPNRIAEVYARVTGERDMAPSSHAGALPEASFGLAGAGAERVEIEMQWGRAERRSLRGEIGYYNPANEQWRFAPEYVARSAGTALMQESLSVVLPAAKEAVAAAAAAGDLAVDMHDPLTQRVRQSMAQRLSAFSPRMLVKRPQIRAALERNGPLYSRVLEADDYTFCYPALSAYRHRITEWVGTEDITVDHDFVAPSQVFTLNFAGVKVEHPNNPGYTLRDFRSVVVAMRSEGDSTIWIPELDSFTPKEWDLLQPIPGELESAAAVNKQFSPLFCAVAYNRPF